MSGGVGRRELNPEIDWGAVQRDAPRAVRRYLHFETDQTVEDLGQECIVRMLRIAAKEEIRNVDATLNHVAHWVAGQHCRRVGRMPVIQPWPEEEHRQPEDESARPSDYLSMDPVGLMRWRTLEFFHETGGCQRIASLYFVGVPFTEIARRLGEKRATVSKRWERCKRRLKEAAHRLPEFAVLREWAEEYL